MNDPTGAATPEAIRLNPGTEELHKSAHNQAVRGERMAMYPNLPAGRCWDREHLELCKDPSNVWAPFTVIRNLLIEAGARSAGSAILMQESERIRWHEYVDALEGKRGEDAKRQAEANGSGISEFHLR